MLNNWIIVLILSLIFSVIFSQFFRQGSKKMKKPGAYVVLLQLISAVISIFLIPLFEIKVSKDPKLWILFIGACFFFAISRRINTIVRSNLYPSIFEIVKRTSTVFIIIFGITFLKEPLLLTRITGAALIIFSSVFVFSKKGKLELNKYFWLAILASFIFSIGQVLNISISQNFNLGIYEIVMFLIPAIFIFLIERISLSDLKNELTKENIKNILIVSVSWTMVSFLNLRTYQLAEASIVAPLFATVVILNLAVGFVFFKERDNLLKKIIAMIIMIIGVILIKL